MGGWRIAAVGRRWRASADHGQPAAAPDRETGARRRGAGSRAATGNAQLAARRSGRDADGLGARELRARCARRPALRERLARLPLYHRRRSHVGLRRRRGSVPARVVRAARKRLHRLRLSPRVRAQRLVVQRASRARRRQSREARLHPAGLRPKRRDVSQRHHRMARERSEGEHVHGHAARAAARGARRAVLEPSDGPRRVQSDGAAGLARLRLALHERQRLGLQQRRRAERQQPERDAAARLRDHGDPAHRSAQPARDERRERARAITRFPPTTSSRPTAIRRRSARSMPTVSATRIGSRGT